MKDFFLRLPIRTKLISSSIFTLLLVSLFIFIYYPSKQKKLALNALENKVRSMAEMVALGVGVGLGSSNYTAITEAMKWAKSDSSLSYIIVIDTTGEEFAAYNPNNLEMDIEKVLSQKRIFEAGGLLHTVVPIRFQKTEYGKLLLGFSLERVYHFILSNKITSLYISLSILILGVIISFIFSNLLTKPIIRLRNVADEVATGNYEVQIKISAYDEIGVLGHAFNKMIEKIKNSIREKEEALQEAVQVKEIQEKIAEKLAKANSQLKTEIKVRKQVEDALYQAKEELELRVQERTRELTKTNKALKKEIFERKQAEKEKTTLEAQLRQSQKMEAIGTLAGGIAHDFNNILWVILGNTEISLRKLTKDSPIRDKLQEILTASKRAKELVEQILTFSRQDKQECKPVQIHLVVKEVLKLLQASLPSTIEIRQRIRDCGTALVDPTQIHQVIMNLCTNAYQAMGEFGGLLEVSMDIVEIDVKSIKNYLELQIGSYIEITISDTGCGMDQATMERIFDPYFTTKGVGEGTGMGLAIVHGIVTRLGGTIKVSSKSGKGSTFRVFLPRFDRSISDESEAKKDTQEVRGDEHILIVDDEKQVVTMVQDMLEELGYKVITQTSSVEALKQFQIQPDRFDLVITDQTMPEMTGIDLAKQLMRIRPDIPIILTTGFSKMVTEEKIKDIGIRDYLKKPIVFHDLENTIRRVLDSKEEI